MSLKAGIVGLPNVGKSTLFNAITKQNILSANYPFATIEPNLGTVFVNDKRLERLNEIFNPKSLVPTSYEFIDIAGLVKGASDGEGLGNKFLSHIREVDAICEVVRCFEDENIIHVNSKVDPISDVEVINLELALADMAIITNRLSKMAKKVKTEKNKSDLLEYETLLKCEEGLKNNISIRRIDLNEEEKLSIKSYNFLTMKPIIYLANIKEEDISYKFNLGELHWMTNASLIKDVVDKETIHIGAMFATEYFYFRLDTEATKNEKIREALLLAIPYEKLRSQYLIPATTLVFPLPDYPRVQGIDEYNVYKAKNILEGVQLNNRNKKTKIILPESTYYDSLAKILKEAW